MNMLTRILNLLRRQPPQPAVPATPQPAAPAIDWDLVLPIAWPATADGWHTVWVPTELATWYVATVEYYSRRLQYLAEEMN